MIDTSVRATSVEPDPVPPRRPLRSRFSAAHLVMVLAALIAFVLVLVALRDSSERVFIAVAAVAVEQGSRFTADAIELQAVPAEATDVLGDLVDADAMQIALDELSVADRTIPAGTTLRLTDLRPVGVAAPHERVMSVGFDAARAAGGSLSAGDVVDVLVARDEGPEVVGEGIEVVAVQSAGGGFGSSSLVLSFAVDLPTALRLAAATVGGEVFVLRATGAAPFRDGADR